MKKCQSPHRTSTSWMRPCKKHIEPRLDTHKISISIIFTNDTRDVQQQIYFGSLKIFSLELALVSMVASPPMCVLRWLSNYVKVLLKYEKKICAEFDMQFSCLGVCANTRLTMFADARASFTVGELHDGSSSGSKTFCLKFQTTN